MRKFDHHCFWLGGCVGELNHGKFWTFLFVQTLLLWSGFSISRSGHRDAAFDYENDEEMRNHIQAVWMFFIGLTFLFMIFTGVLCAYHTYLIMSGQTTWEHSGRFMITYLRPYKHGQMPFFKGISGNIAAVFCHNNQCQEWELIQPAKLRETQGFNVCDNEYYSCC